ncbi:hypothetical protein L218DRAFT_651928 [Marasmius fiardii PR-910]|nr:hypothetical protein L218DRAFT_651928 [Marasmius fiardii PR-910]
MSLPLDIPGIASSLRSFGIRHDDHLELLEVLGSVERRDVLKNIPNVSAIDAFALIRHLEKQFELTPRMRESPHTINMTHHASFNSENPLSPRLKSTLERKHMNALIPVATLYRFFDDRQLDRHASFDDSDLDDFFDSYNLTKASLFYRRLLRVALKAAATV